MAKRNDGNTAKTAPSLPAQERRERAKRALTLAGKPEAMRFFDFREATSDEREFGKTLEPLAERCLSRGKRKVA